MKPPTRGIFPNAGAPAEQLTSEFAHEMRKRWRTGERPPAEDFLHRAPELFHRPETAVDLIYEEFCLRQAAGENGAEADILRRFPQWAGPLGVMFDCHQRLLKADHDRPQFPEAGDRVGDFRLLSELARGSRGRVFLANETALGDRAAVLKITPLDEGQEHLSLARLQHTNIVPLYSVFDDPGRRVRVLCMPYFGRATLAVLLTALDDVPVAARTGADVVRAMDRMETGDGPPAPVGSAARQMLEQVSYVQAMCWIAACLADALQFAHERGVVHLDLKPSNVLLATDGQPMLLDFHLAREPVCPGGAMPDHFGGTPPYMPPEQLAAMQSLQDGRPVEVTVDARADIYALGAMLFEALGGGRLPVSGDTPRMETITPHISAGLCDVIAKCVTRVPQDRYADAASLADDLRRHLTDQPLVGVPNRSTVERWRKWRRRRPDTLRAGATFAFVLGTAAVLMLGARTVMRDRELQVELALADADRQSRAGHFAEAVSTLERGVTLVKPFPFEQPLEQRLLEQLSTARRLQFSEQLHELADEVRVLYGVESIPEARLRSLASQCDTFWNKRDAILDSLRGSQTPRAQLAADLQDIAIFTASLHAKLSPDAPEPALRFLDEAEAMFGPSAALDQERRTRRLAAGLSEATPSVTARRSPTTASEHCALGRAYLVAGDLPRAMEELVLARQLEPAGRWSNFYYGVCAYRAGKHEEAVAAFSVCIGAAPGVAACFYNRGLAYVALGRTDDALNDFDRALALDPLHAQARQAGGAIR